MAEWRVQAGGATREMTLATFVQFMTSFLWVPTTLPLSIKQASYDLLASTLALDSCPPRAARVGPGPGTITYSPEATSGSPNP